MSHSMFPFWNGRVGMGRTFGNPLSSQSLIMSANCTALSEMYSGVKLVRTAFKTGALDRNGDGK